MKEYLIGSNQKLKTDAVNFMMKNAFTDDFVDRASQSDIYDYFFWVKASKVQNYE